MIIRHIIRLGRAGEDMPDTLPSRIQNPKPNLSPAQTASPDGHRRMPTLHVMQFSKLIQRHSSVSTLDTFFSSAIWHVILSIFFLGATATLIAFGLY